MTPLYTDADQNLLRALPAETRKAVAALTARTWKRGIADAAECVREVSKGPGHGAARVVYQSIADALQRYGETPLPLDFGNIPTPDPMTLEDHEILDLPPLDRAKVLADLASQGLILAVMLVDVGVPCAHCDGGKVSMVIDGTQQRVDCTRCDGVGAVDGRRRCADRECLSYGQPLTYSLCGGWECSRKHGHDKPPLPPGPVARLESEWLASVVEAMRGPLPLPGLSDEEMVGELKKRLDPHAVTKAAVDTVTDPDAFPWDTKGAA